MGFLRHVYGHREELVLGRTIILLRRQEARYGEVQSFVIVVACINSYVILYCFDIFYRLNVITLFLCVLGHIVTRLALYFLCSYSLYRLCRFLWIFMH